MKTITPNIQRVANSVARKAGYGKATEIVINSSCVEPNVISHTSYGYRKRTTGEYVPMAYINNFGWKNCYYQHAETVVELPAP